MRARFAPALLVCLLAACATAPEVTAPTESPAQPPNFPAAFYIDAAARGEPVYRVNSEGSQVVVRVYRAGSLARFGHDHVIAGRDVRGYALWPKDFRKARADVYVAVDTFSVDEPALRARAGLETQPSQSDIEGTRRNMRKVLDAETYPFVVLHLVPAAAEQPPPLVLLADVTLHGATRRVSIPADIEISNGPTLYVRGRFSVNQTDFGIKPYSLMGGALQVQDKVDIEFDLTLSPLPR
jgi:hypothetical protein